MPPHLYLALGKGLAGSKVRGGVSNGKAREGVRELVGRGRFMSQTRMRSGKKKA